MDIRFTVLDPDTFDALLVPYLHCDVCGEKITNPEEGHLVLPPDSLTGPWYAMHCACQEAFDAEQSRRWYWHPLSVFLLQICHNTAIDLSLPDAEMARARLPLER